VIRLVVMMGRLQIFTKGLALREPSCDRTDSTIMDILRFTTLTGAIPMFARIDLSMKAMSSITILTIFSSLGGCQQDNSSGYFYRHTDANFQIAIRDAQSNFPEYFKVLRETGTEDQLVGRQVYGLNVECLSFENYSSIIIEIDLPMYCFQKGTDKLVAKF
jgi:hypothetical protein